MPISSWCTCGRSSTSTTRTGPSGPTRCNSHRPNSCWTRTGAAAPPSTPWCPAAASSPAPWCASRCCSRTCASRSAAACTARWCCRTRRSAATARSWARSSTRAARCPTACNSASTAAATRSASTSPSRAWCWSPRTCCAACAPDGMADPARLPVILLWHMHQPQYRDALTGEYTLPWTYLHAIKDYTDMAAHLEANPAARAVVNFTPVLIEQLDELARRIQEHLQAGTPLPDPVLNVLGPDPVPQEPAQRLELLKACLRAQRKQMIERFGPYLELATIAEMLATPGRVRYASAQLIYDLGVWYHLAWLGDTVRRAHPLVGALTEQGRDFTAEQRRQLLALIGDL